MFLTERFSRSGIISTVQSYRPQPCKYVLKDNTQYYGRLYSCVYRERGGGGEEKLSSDVPLYIPAKSIGMQGGGTFYSVDKNINVYLLIANPRIYFRL